MADLPQGVLPPLRPAILAALVYSFVHTTTAISAIIFLVSTRYEMSASYIVGRVENNGYGIGRADVTTLQETGREMSMVLQSYALFPQMSIKKNVEYRQQ